MTIKSQELSTLTDQFQVIMTLDEWLKRISALVPIYGPQAEFSVGNTVKPRIRGRTTAVASPPTVTVAPVITGSGHTAVVMSSDTGTWTSEPDYYTYQWFEGVTAKGGSTASTYTIVSGDDTKSITCKVTAWHVGNITGSTASQSNAVTAANP